LMYEVVATRPGVAQDVVEVRSMVLGQRERGMLRIRMLASTINPSDLVTIAGAYRSRTSFPFIGGFEGVGEVVAADPCTSLVEGTRVIPIRRAGCWSELRDVPESDCVPVPEYLSTERACFAYINPMTTVSMVSRYVTGHGPVIVTAATSEAATQIAALLKFRNVPAIGITRSSDRPPSNGKLWSAIIATDAPEWEERLYAAAGQSAHVVFDAVGGLNAGKVARALEPGGQFISYGLLSGTPIHGSWEFPSHVELKYFHLRQDAHNSDPVQFAQRFEEVFQFVASGLLATTPAAKFPLSQIRGALAWNSANRGKVLLEINAEAPR
ncbi:zinc-dependent alcohol dehydrogenase family protein, partial [Brachybacterium alimentarium]